MNAPSSKASKLQALLQEATLHHQAGRFAEAEKACRRILRDRPSHPETNFILGIVLKSQGKVPEAEAAFRRAVLGAPDVAAGHNNLGSILFLKASLRRPRRPIGGRLHCNRIWSMRS
jgi:Flp pilus assembly protein TadD